MNHFWELLWGMTDKELRSRYKHTMFGFLWMIVNPLLQMLIIGFIFPLVIKQTVAHYYFYLFTGLLIWNFFSLSLNKATPSIVNERSLIKKSFFPRSVIPVSIIFSNLIHYLAALVLFFIPILFIQHFSMMSLVYFISSLLLLITFTIGFCLLTSALNVRYRDINFFVQAILIIWFYATPIVYSLSQIPHRLLWLWRLNPLTSVLQLMQQALLNAPGPGPAMLVSNLSVILIFLIAGIYTFNRENKTFDDWL